MKFDMKEAIKECEKIKRPDEEIVFAIGAGKISFNPFFQKAQNKAIEHIKTLEGFIGVYPGNEQTGWRPLFIFNTLNNAKRGLNSMKNNNINVGNVIPILVEKIYLKGMKEHEE